MLITAADNLYPHKTAVILNPYSGQVRRRLDSIRQLSACIPGVTIHEAGSLTDLDQIVSEVKLQERDHLVVIGGDGTVQAVLNRLLSGPEWRSFPLLSIVPGGTTNMTATDIGSCGRAEKKLQRLVSSLQSASGVNLITRPVLHIQQDNQTDVYGMFFGAGIIARGARFFHTHIKKSGLLGESASALVMLHLLTGLLSGRNSEEFQASHIRLQDDNRLVWEQRSLLMFASTLDRLLLGMRPYWGAGQGQIHTTILRDKAVHFWRALPKILCRKGGLLTVENGYYSRNNTTLELLMDEDYIVDGEFFHCDSQNGPLRISATRPIKFLVAHAP